ncbi:wax ester/triacylglycerol synthase family O-acyltransferase [soil metagenome]
MNHLSGMDASFLHLESSEMPMHVASLEIFELPEGYEGDFFAAAKDYTGSRLHLAEVFQRKLALMPFELANPVWIEDFDVDLDHHIRNVVLPRPGTWQQLERLVGRLHSTLLDRSRPLWEMTIIEGLQDGRIGVYTKVHHAAVDGQGGVAVTKALLSDTPNPGPVKPPRGRRQHDPAQLGMAELASAAIGNAFQQYVKLVKAVPTGAKALANVLLPVSEADGKRRLTSGKIQRAPRTPLNVALTNQRAYAARSLPLAEIKAMAKTSGASLNDIVLAICAGSLKKYLAEYDCKPVEPLLAAVPVSLREAGNTDPNNQVSVMMVSLATDIEDPLERLKAINESSVAAKKLTGTFKEALGLDFPSLGVPWVMSGLASMYGRSKLADRLPPAANVAISNVPGPQMPLYFAGALLTGFYPVSIPGHGMALNMTVQSYNGSLDIGLTACRRAMPDVGDLADYLVAEHRMLFELIMGKPAAEALVAGPAVRQAERQGVRQEVHAEAVLAAPKAAAAVKGIKGIKAVPKAAGKAASASNGAARKRTRKAAAPASVSRAA